MPAWLKPNDLPQHFALSSESPCESPPSSWRLSLEHDRLQSSMNHSHWSTPTSFWQSESGEGNLEGYTFPLSKGGSTSERQSLPGKSHNSLGLSMDSSVLPTFDDGISTSSYALGLVFGTVERDRQSSCSSNSSYASTSSVLSYLTSPSNSPALVPVSLPSPQLIPFDPPTSEPLKDLSLTQLAKDDTPPTPFPQPLALPGLPSLPSRLGVLRGEAYGATSLPPTTSNLPPLLKNFHLALEPSSPPSRRLCTHLDPCAESEAPAPLLSNGPLAHSTSTFPSLSSPNEIAVGGPSSKRPLPSTLVELGRSSLFVPQVPTSQAPQQTWSRRSAS